MGPTALKNQLRQLARFRKFFFYEGVKCQMPFFKNKRVPDSTSGTWQKINSPYGLLGTWQNTKSPYGLSGPWQNMCHTTLQGVCNRRSCQMALHGLGRTFKCHFALRE